MKSLVPIKQSQVSLLLEEEQKLEQALSGLQVSVIEIETRLRDVRSRIEAAQQSTAIAKVVDSTIVVSGKTRELVFALIEKLNLTPAGARDLVTMKGHYQTNFQAIQKLVDYGYDISGIEIILEVRELLRDERAQQTLSLENIDRLHRQFYDLPFESERMADVIQDLIKRFDAANGNSAIGCIIAYAQNFQFDSLERTLEALDDYPLGHFPNMDDEFRESLLDPER